MADPAAHAKPEPPCCTRRGSVRARVTSGAPHDGDSQRSVLPRWLVRAVIAVLGFASLSFAVLADAPDRLPSVALGQELMYRLELLLGSLFSGLLVATPLLQGVINGRLPTEITARGAKYDPEEVSQGLAALEDRISQIEAAVTKTGGEALALRADVEVLKERLPSGEDRI